MPSAKKHAEPEKHRLSAKEITDLRVSHGIAYEKEHDVEHYIDEATHPQYEITGFVKEEQDAHHRMLHEYF